MAQFACNFTVEEITPQVGAQISWGTIIEISPQLVGQIPWRTYIEIISKSKSHEEMLWYINQTHKYGWSRSQVLQKFKEQAYERNLIEPSTSISVKSDDSTNEIFKDVYVFDFLNEN